MRFSGSSCVLGLGLAVPPNTSELLLLSLLALPSVQKTTGESKLFNGRTLEFSYASK